MHRILLFTKRRHKRYFVIQKKGTRKIVATQKVVEKTIWTMDMIAMNGYEQYEQYEQQKLNVFLLLSYEMVALCIENYIKNMSRRAYLAAKSEANLPA